MRFSEIISEASVFGRNHNQAYDLMVNSIDCGPFDGGCVTVAMALQMVLGGEIVVLVGRANRNSQHEAAMHAALHYRGQLIDADGALDARTFINRFVKNEMAHVGGTITGVRAIESGDLPDAPRDAELAKKLSQQIQI